MELLLRKTCWWNKTKNRFINGVPLSNYPCFHLCLISDSLFLYYKVKTGSKIHKKSLIMVLFCASPRLSIHLSSSAFKNPCQRRAACRIMSDIVHMQWILLGGINKKVGALGRWGPPLKVLQRSLGATADWWRPHKGFIRRVSKGLVLSPAVTPVMDHLSGL